MSESDDTHYFPQTLSKNDEDTLQKLLQLVDGASSWNHDSYESFVQNMHQELAQSTLNPPILASLLKCACDRPRPDTSGILRILMDAGEKQGCTIVDCREQNDFFFSMVQQQKKIMPTILEKYPECLEWTHLPTNRNALHEYCSGEVTYDFRPDVAWRMIELYPDALQRVEQTRSYLPIHIICDYYMRQLSGSSPITLEFIEKVIDKYPACLDGSIHGIDSPLEIICKKLGKGGRSRVGDHAWKLCLMIAQRFPPAVRVRSLTSRARPLPIHHFMRLSDEYDKVLPILRVIVYEYPESIDMETSIFQDGERSTPRDVAFIRIFTDLMLKEREYRSYLEQISILVKNVQMMAHEPSQNQFQRVWCIMNDYLESHRLHIKSWLAQLQQQDTEFFYHHMDNTFNPSIS